MPYKRSNASSYLYFAACATNLIQPYSMVSNYITHSFSISPLPNFIECAESEKVSCIDPTPPSENASP
jgi:hypothetical protein